MKIDYGWEGPQDFRCWGPYWSFGTHADTEITVSWQSKFHALEHWLEFGENLEKSTRIHEKIEPTTMHSFHLRDLKPNTTYYYKISRVEDQQISPQPIYSFHTGPTQGTALSFDFCIIGDFHAKTQEGTQEILQGIVKNVPNRSFLVSTGDAITHGGDETAWNDFFYQMKPYTSEFPVMHTTGNHDTDHPETYAHFIQTFHFPYHDSTKGAFYHYIYGNAVFIMLDSTNAGQAAATQGVVSDEQLEWLEAILTEYGKKNYWVFIFMHHPMYSTGDSGMMNIYELAYRDLFDEYHVDAVFYGHDHIFEVYWTGRDLDWGGTHYCLVGNSGNCLGTFIRDPARNSPYLWKGRTYIPSRDGMLGGKLGGMRNDEIIKTSYVYGIIERGFTHIHIDGDRAELKMWGLENQIYFRDQFKRTGCGKKYKTLEYIQEF
jgi:predicted phosphodiesterase